MLCEPKPAKNYVYVQEQLLGRADAQGVEDRDRVLTQQFNKECMTHHGSIDALEQMAMDSDEDSRILAALRLTTTPRRRTSSPNVSSSSSAIARDGSSSRMVWFERYKRS